jgi:hypothetical protein
LFQGFIGRISANKEYPDTQDISQQIYHTENVQNVVKRSEGKQSNHKAFVETLVVSEVKEVRLPDNKSNHREDVQSYADEQRNRKNLSKILV